MIYRDDEYYKLEEEFVVAEYKKTKPKPNQMVGKWGWHARKKREFKRMMIEQGRIEDDKHPDNNLDD